MKAIPIILLALALSGDTRAQEPSRTPRIEPQPWVQGTPNIPDVPAGFPYNVGAMAADSRSTDVPLRDYMSSRVDQLRGEILDRLELLDRQQQALINERDRQYAQRFAAQEAATNISLSAAKEAVAKAEDAADRRFASVNEFRQSLDDQSRTLMPRSEAEARFKAIEDKTANNTQVLQSIQASDEGASSTWALVAAVIFFIIALGTFAMGYSRFRERAAT